MLIPQLTKELPSMADCLKEAFKSYDINCFGIGKWPETTYGNILINYDEHKSILNNDIKYPSR